MKHPTLILACLALVACAHTPTPTTPRPPRPKPLATVLWTDSIQSSCEAPYGFSQIQLERPIGEAVQGNGEVNLTRVQNPIGAGFALKHLATFDNDGGSRSQAGIYSFANDVFENQVKSQEGIWIAAEWYFPAALTADSGLDSNPWVNLWDFHSVGPNSRWDTQPGLMLAEDGSMRVKWSWHERNPETAWSDVALPVGEWFDIEMHYVWTTGASACGEGATVSLWVNGELTLEQSGVVTKDASHDSVETYQKFYGSANSGNTWTPTPSVKYVRNVRMADGRIWR
jgi:hypothetical protein